MSDNQVVQRTSVSASILTGAARTAVPRDQGGDARSLQELVRAIAVQSHLSLAMGIRAASQRLLVEVLLQSENAGLREYRLSSLLDGDITGNCAGMWPGRESIIPAAAREVRRGWLIDGETEAMPNLGRDWFLAIVPVHFEGEKTFSLVLLRSDEDGVDRLETTLPGLDDIQRASLRLRRVFFREDELVAADGPTFMAQMAPLAAALKSAVMAGACLSVVDSWSDARERAEVATTVERLLAECWGGKPEFALLGLRRQVAALVTRQVATSTPVSAERRAVLAQLKHL